jgi:hypothetical protein
MPREKNTMPTALDPGAKAARNARRKEEAASAQRDFEIESQRVADNTARLRALRLAKEEYDRAHPPLPPVKKKKAVKKAAAKAIPIDRLNASNDD